MKTKNQVLITASMLTALTCAATMLIKIPSPLNGYINIGDCLVLLCGWLLGPAYGFLAAGLGSGLADFFSGYMMYVPATLAIKGLMALAACKLRGSSTALPRLIGSGLVAEAIMVLGYLAFESLLYGFGPSLVNVPANCVQGAAGLILGVLLLKALEKQQIK